jgi:hypothetical protein
MGFDDHEREGRLDRLIARNRQLETENKKLVAERNEANRRRDETQHHIHDLLNSRSWKIAAPFRSLGAVARRGRNVMKQRFGSKLPMVEDQPLTLEAFVKSHSRLLLVNAAPSFDPKRDDVALGLADAAADAGHAVVFICWQEGESDEVPGRFTLMRPNLFQIGRFDIKELVSVLRHVKPASATLLVTAPSLEIVQSLVGLEAAGVRIIYYKLCEWAQVSSQGEAPWFEERLEKHLILNAEKVTVVGTEAAPLTWAEQLERILQ